MEEIDRKEFKNIRLLNAVSAACFLVYAVVGLLVITFWLEGSSSLSGKQTTLLSLMLLFAAVVFGWCTNTTHKLLPTSGSE